LLDFYDDQRLWRDVMNCRFGPFELDRGQSTLTGPEGRIALRPKPFALLLLLVDRAPALVLHDDIIDAIWGHSALSRNVLPQTVRELRMALGDTGETPLYVETQHRRGYRWIAPVEIVSRSNAAGQSGTDLGQREAGSGAELSAQAMPRKNAWRNGLIALFAVLVLGALGFLLSRAMTERVAGSAAELPAVVLEIPTLAAAQRATHFLPLIEAVLRWQYQVLPADAGSSADARLDLSVLDDTTLAWELFVDGSAAASGRFAAATAWGDLDELVRQLDTALDRDAAGLGDVWPRAEAQRAAFAEALADAERREIDSARDGLAAVLAAEPDAVAARLALVDIDVDSGWWNAARAIVTVPATPSSDSPVAQRMRASLQATAAVLAGQPAVAAEGLSAWLATHPDDLSLRLAQAELWLNQARADEAFAALRGVPADLNSHPEALLLQLRAAAITGDRFNAGRLFDALLARLENDRSPDAVHVGLALAEETRRSTDSERWARLKPLLDASSDDAAFRIARWDAISGDPVAALAAFERIGDAAFARGDRYLAARAVYERSVLLNRSGGHATAIAEVRGMIERMGDEDDPRALSLLHLGLATVLATSGDADGARAALADAQAHADVLADPIRQAAIQTNLGMQLAMQDRVDEAEAAIVRARELFRQTADLRGELINVNNLGALQSRRNRLEQSRDLYLEALALAERGQDQAEIARAAFNLGQVETRLDNVAAARERIMQGMVGFTRSGGRAFAARAAALLVDLDIASADPASARAVLAAVGDLDTLPPFERARVLLARSRIAEVGGDDATARRDLDDARKGFDALDRGEWVRKVDIRLARIAVRAGEPIAPHLARVRVLRQDMERLDAAFDAMQGALADIELTGCVGNVRAATADLRTVEIALEAERLPELLLRADVLALRFGDDALGLVALADEVERRGHRLAALGARAASSSSAASSDVPLPDGIAAPGLAHCVSTAF
jgi:DNA-binding winged helix-turn-helix (wHTH) protein/tetratricopeptide (TPR) repeat protein